MSASVSQYVLKVHSRCDLSCDHCYVYQHADQSWRERPKTLAVATASQAARRIAEHAVTHRIDDVHVVLHGGEPLLLGHDGLGRVLMLLRSLIEPATRLNLRIQTNGVLLDEKLCDLFANHGVQVGVSLDGDRTANDRHRIFSDGRGSHEHVLRALTLLRRPEFKHLYAGILCTVDLRNDPITVYEALIAESPPGLDLLLPHATWDRPPQRPPNARAPYAEWLGRIHSRWIADGRPVPIRLFDSLRSAAEGYRSWTEAVGLDPVDLLVIETDGSWEQADSLKTAFHGAPATGLNVFSHSVDDAAAHPGIAGRRAGAASLCGTCRACPVVRTCGGGLYAHRHRSRNGFNNPSVYCDDLKVLISYVTVPQKPKPPPPARTREVLPGHALPAEAFDALAAGAGDTAAMSALTEARWSVTRALVAKVAASLQGSRGNLGRAAAEGWALLDRLDGERPAAVREILSYPYVQAWAMRCLRAGPEGACDLDLAHIAGVAAAAALRAGLTTELVLPVREGCIYLPSFGALAVDCGSECLTVRVSPSGIRPAVRTHGWQTVRHAGAAGISVAVDDLDPFRDCQLWLAAGRLPDARWQEWRMTLAGAARQLTSVLPAYARVIGTGLGSVVPIQPGPVGYNRSATAPHAFGAVALMLPADVNTLSVLLLHEMQHVKLGALSELYDLFNRSDGRLLRVPWRLDPRPVEAVLQGAYAHLAIAEFWRAQAREQPGGPAPGLFLKYRAWVSEVIEELLGAEVLTPQGARFARGMRTTVERQDGGR